MKQAGRMQREKQAGQVEVRMLPQEGRRGATEEKRAISPERVWE